ncbi:ABC transporter permease [Coprothermobacteraceae bacterium]|nr:ABC transporter permease [Coprothermobacteraceae bacterium]
MNYLIKRVLQLIPTFLVATLIAFILFSLVGDPFEGLRQDPRLASQVERLRRIYGYDKDPITRYFLWIKNFLQGEWGYSIMAKRAVFQVVMERLPVSLSIGIVNTVLATLFGILLGIYSAIHLYSAADYAATALVFFGMSMPSFFFGVMALFFFVVTIPLFNVGLMTPGFHPDIANLFDKTIEYGRHLALPIFILTLLGMGGFVRYSRSAMLEVLHMDYIRTARAKGLPESVVIRKHALRNALIPIVTLLALSLPAIIGAAPITETIFSINGLGKLYIDALGANDIMVLMADLTLTISLVIIGNLLADILYAVVDPRVTLE